MNIKTKGFTLIELLVVIAIIGILSSVVLASLNSARSKGSDAAVKSNMNGIRAQAELYYDDNGNQYNTTNPSAVSTGATCTAASSGLFADTNIANAMKGIDNNNGSGTVTCIASTTGWAISSDLLGGGSWCVDGSGKTSTTTAAVSGC
jgi:prepilin-type N-terminal cleavage/methylation domain-containing protein